MEHIKNYLKDTKKYNFPQINIFSGCSPTLPEFDSENN